jgi:hypothetical protein
MLKAILLLVLSAGPAPSPRPVSSPVLRLGAAPRATPRPTGVPRHRAAARRARLPFERIPLVGAATQDVAVAYGVAVPADGSTFLIGDRRAYDWHTSSTLSIEAIGGRVVRAVWQSRLDALRMARAALGDSTSGGCWSQCDWDRGRVTFTLHNTRTVNYTTLVLE